MSNKAKFWIKVKMCKDQRPSSALSGDPKMSDLLVLEERTLLLERTGTGNMRTVDPSAEVSASWRKAARSSSQYQNELRLWGFGSGNWRSRPYWASSKLAVDPQNKPHWLDKWTGNQGRTRHPLHYPGPDGCTHRWTEYSPALRTYLHEISTTADREGHDLRETRRRSDQRSHYCFSAWDVVRRTKGALDNETFSNTEEKTVALSRLWWQARQVLKRKQGEAMARWPDDLTQPCPGDAGAIGELALLGRELPI